MTGSSPSESCSASGSDVHGCLNIKLKAMSVVPSANAPQTVVSVQSIDAGEFPANKARFVLELQPLEDANLSDVIQDHQTSACSLPPSCGVTSKTFKMGMWSLPAWSNWKAVGECNSGGIIKFDETLASIEGGTCSKEIACLEAAGFKEQAGNPIILYRLLFSVYDFYLSKYDASKKGIMKFEETITPASRLAFVKKCLEISNKSVNRRGTVFLTTGEISEILDEKITIEDNKIKVVNFSTNKPESYPTHVFLIYTFTFSNPHCSLPEVDLRFPFKIKVGGKSIQIVDDNTSSDLNTMASPKRSTLVDLFKALDSAGGLGVVTEGSKTFAQPKTGDIVDGTSSTFLALGGSVLEKEGDLDKNVTLLAGAHIKAEMTTTEGVNSFSNFTLTAFHNITNPNENYLFPATGIYLLGPYTGQSEAGGSQETMSFGLEAASGSDANFTLKVPTGTGAPTKNALLIVKEVCL